MSHFSSENIKSKHQGIPSPSYRNGTQLYSILRRVHILPIARFRYAEPTIDQEGSVSWLIEYDCILNVYKKADYVHFVNTFKTQFERKVPSVVVTVRYNMKDRVTLICRPLSTKIQFVKSVHPDVVINDVTTTSTKDNTTETKLPTSSSISSNVVSVQCEELNSEVPSVKTPVEKSSPVTVESQETKVLALTTPVISSESTQKIDSLKVENQNLSNDLPVATSSSAPDRMLFPPPIVRLTQDSRQYALSRFRSTNIYDMARLYIAYLSRVPPDTSFNGETSLSIGRKIKSEGLPLGSDLTSLYYEYHTIIGFTRDEVRADLDTKYAHCVSKRMQHLSLTQEAARKWRGLKGGFVAPLSNKLQVNLMPGRSVPTAVITLDGQPIKRFE